MLTSLLDHCVTCNSHRRRPEFLAFKNPWLQRSFGEYSMSNVVKLQALLKG
jgi:hypothetical protein